MRSFFVDRVKIGQHGWVTFVAMLINAWKWEGTGNAFILLDRRDCAVLPDAATIAAMCDAANGVGADGLIFFQPLNNATDAMPCSEWGMDYVNADGSRSFCGNGSRALFAFLRGEGWMPQSGGSLHACDGCHAVAWDEVHAEPGVELRSIAPPKAAAEGATFVDTGSPHHLIWVENTAARDVVGEGRAIRYGVEYAPDGTNVDFVQRIDADALAMRTYERGVEAETRACGTGAVAAAVADHAERGGSLRREVRMPGGTLRVQLHEPEKTTGAYSNVWLYGAANEVLRAAWNGLKWTVLVVALGMGWMPAAAAQGNWTDEVEVSVLTGSPGPDLYSAWGHTAIRVFDPGQTPPVDWTYNYGTFEFGEGFYLRFMRGELNYRLAKSPFSSLQREYMHFERAILEQPLALSPDDARALVAYLEWNYLPENRVYAYKFFEDNCSSRVLTVLHAVFGDRWDSGCAVDAALGVTYREALRPYMHGDAWIETGIDFILGPRADRLMPPCGSSFLPDGLMQQLQNATLDGRSVAGPAEELLPPQRSWFRSVVYTPALAHPVMWCALVLIWTLVWSVRRLLSHRAGRVTSSRERRAGKAVQVLAGVLGLLLLAMWTLTDHRDTWSNWNMLWASPFLPLLWFLPKGRWHRWSRWILSVGVVGFLLLFIFVPQFVPLSMLLLGWAVWLSLDPWKVPWSLSDAAKQEP
jgi:diaminopimelate epimerase